MGSIRRSPREIPTTTQTASQMITAEVASLGVTAGPGRRGEYAFRVGRREIGHLHGDDAAHFSFPKTVWAELMTEGRSAAPLFPDPQGPAARRITNDDDGRDVIALMRLNYDRAVARHACRPRHDGPRDYPAPRRPRCRRGGRVVHRRAGAEERGRLAVPGGKLMQVELRFGSSTVMLADEFPDMGVLAAQHRRYRTVLHLTTEDWTRSGSANRRRRRGAPARRGLLGRALRADHRPVRASLGAGAAIRDVSREQLKQAVAELFSG